MTLKSLVKLAFGWAQRSAQPWLRYALHRAHNGYLHARRGLTLNCLGDSHNTVFHNVQRARLIPDVFIRCTTIVGATVLGLANPRSKTNAMPIFAREIRALPKRQALCIMLGEVDCGFPIFLRSQRNGTPVSDETEESLRRYRGFLAPVAGLGLAKTVVCSVPPPTISDHSQLSSVANLRREVRASIQERTALTREYNTQLRRITENLGFVFLDMDRVLIDEQSGLVRQDLLNPNPRDHHLNMHLVAPRYADALRQGLGLDRSAAR